MRNNDHETRFCGNVGGGGLRRRIYSRLCPRGLWAWRRVCEPWRLRAQSYHSPGITSAADARLPKPDSGPARGTCAAARHQRTLGAQPIRGGYVGAQPFTRTATPASPGLLPILLLVGSNLFMTLVSYGHLRFKEVPGAACAQLPSLPRSCGNLDSSKLARRGGQTSVQMAVRLHSRLYPG